MKPLITAILFASFVLPVFADYKIVQETKVEDVTTQYTVYSKGVRQRRESKMIFEGVSAEDLQMMGNMMPPSLIEIIQCDLKQNVMVNDKTRRYFIDYYDWSSLPQQKTRTAAQPVSIKGTTTVSSTVADSGKRQQMFGLTARWVKAVQTVDNSADSCDDRSLVRIEREGWFVDLTLASERCATPLAPTEAKGGCRSRVIVQGAQDPGFFLEGTTRMYENNKLQATTTLRTTALSKAVLDQALFEIPKGYAEAASMSDLMGAPRMPDMPSTPIVSGPTRPAPALKNVGISAFTGTIAKLDQDRLRAYISQRLNAAGLSGQLISSPADVGFGNFANVIGVEVKKVKESGASKIGGLFGKVTGNTDSSRIGKTQAEIVVTVYAKDGRTVIASTPASVDVSGNATDAVMAAIEQVLGGLISKIK